MEPVGFNPSVLLVELIPVVLVIGLSVITLIDPAMKKMSGTVGRLGAHHLCYSAFGGARVLGRQTHC